VQNGLSVRFGSNDSGTPSQHGFSSRHHAISQAAKKGNFIVNISEKWFRQDWESHVTLEHWLSGRVFQLTVTQAGDRRELSRVLGKKIQYERVGTEQFVKDVVELTVPHLVQHVHEVAIDRSSLFLV
jgi:hypothetical protein